MNTRIKILISVLVIVIIVLAVLCIVGTNVISSQKKKYERCNLNKITFDLNEIDENGLIGPLDGKVSVDYEFCIPYKDQCLQEIKAIDPDIKYYLGYHGRIGCGDDEYLCIGNTGHKNFKSILCRLSMLDYIKRIDRTWWE